MGKAPSKAMGAASAALPAYDLKSWMSWLPAEKKAMPIGELTLPGTHDSGAYQVDWGGASYQSNPVIYGFSQISNYMPPLQWMIQPYVQTQSKNIKEQLESGARVLDLRVAIKPESEEVFVAHGYMCVALSEVIKQVNDFLAKNLYECLVITVKPDHANQALLETDNGTLESKILKALTPLQKHCYPRQAGQAFSSVSVKDMLAKDKRVMLTYKAHNKHVQETINGGSSPKSVLPGLAAFSRWIQDGRAVIENWANTASVTQKKEETLAKVQSIQRKASQGRSTHTYNEIPITLTPQRKDLYNGKLLFQSVSNLAKSVSTITLELLGNILKTKGISAVLFDFLGSNGTEQAIRQVIETMLTGKRPVMAQGAGMGAGMGMGGSAAPQPMSSTPYLRGGSGSNRPKQRY